MKSSVVKMNTDLDFVVGVKEQTASFKGARGWADRGNRRGPAASGEMGKGPHKAFPHQF